MGEGIPGRMRTRFIVRVPTVKDCDMGDQPNRLVNSFIDRRRFLKMLGLSGISLFLAGCRGNHPAATASPTPRTPTSFVPSLTRRATASPTKTATPRPKSMAAIGQADAYEPHLLRREMERMLSATGLSSNRVKPGARVGIKVNLTGGTWWDAEGKPPATELFVTHPAVVGVLGELLLDLGAGTLTILDGLGDETNFQKWGYVEMAKPLGAKLLDLCKPDPYTSFKSFPVGPKAFLYDRFDLNAALGEFDVFLSVGKMKCHSTTGVTLSLKNLIGPDQPVSAAGAGEQPVRLP
jgi:hypothetical protein